MESPAILEIAASYEENSVDSNFDTETPTAITSIIGNAKIGVSLECTQYDAAALRAEFKTYQSILPKPGILLQEQHSFQMLRKKIQQSDIELPRFLKYKSEGGIKPHHALCSLLLSDYEEGAFKEKARVLRYDSSLIRILSFGSLQRQLNNPADLIRDQFSRVVPAIPATVVSPIVLRKKIRNRGLPIPNYFLDPEDDKQFPPHIALLVILQDGEKESKYLGSILYHMAFSLFAAVALILRIVLEVIGGAGAIWGGAEVFTLRNADNAELWRWISVAVGVLCFLRFVTLNVPQEEDDGDILGAAGPWSLRLPLRMRAVCEHPFHYFVRATRPPSSLNKKDD